MPPATAAVDDERAQSFRERLAASTAIRDAATIARHMTASSGRSQIAARLVSDLLAVDVLPRRLALAGLDGDELAFVMRETERETGSMYGMWHDTPSGFAEDVLGASLWDLQRESLDAVVKYKRTAVPAGFGVGKTMGSGLLVAWAGSVNAPGSMRVVTMATRFRQVRNQLWPHIRKAHARGNLPGQCDLTQWTMPSHLGNDVQVAYGFTASDNDESSMQGIHGTPKLLLIVDEAGGIPKLTGRGTNNLLTGEAKMIAIGNPAMDDPGSWFEELCAEGENPDKPTSITVSIPTLASPAISGDPAPRCRECEFNNDGHTIAAHMPDRDWLLRTLEEYGTVVAPDATIGEIAAAAQEGHPYLIAKVLAQFPKGGTNRVMPASWVEGAVESLDPNGPDFVPLSELGLEGEFDPFTVQMGSWVRLGVDVAADGGDEFAIYRCVGDVIHKVHTSSGSKNADATQVAERVLEEIDRAQRLADRLASKHKIRVKVDRNGLGWGTASNLERWGETGRHKAQIVGVMVSEKPERDDPTSVMRPWRKRDEMWLAGRWLLQPDPSTGFGRIRLRVDHECKVQMSNPMLLHNTQGFVQVESKKAMKARGVHSPDRAEAALLSIYEPTPLGAKRRRGLLQ